MKRIAYWTGLILLLAATGCRQLILEKRHECPAWVDLQAQPPVNGERWAYLQLWLLRETGESGEGLWVPAEQLNQGFRLEWEKDSPCEVTGLSGWTGKFLPEDGRLLIPEGRPCPDALGAHLQEALSRDENYRFMMDIKHLSINVLFDIIGSNADELSPVVRGAVDGYHFPSLRLHEGPFRCAAEALEDGTPALRIPRQEDLSAAVSYTDRLILELSPDYTFPLGALLREKGYDWQAPVPDDIRIGILCAGDGIRQLSVQSRHWKQIVIENGKNLL